MVKENIRQEFRMKNINKTSSYFVEEIDQNKLKRKKYKKVCTTLIYIEYFLVLAYAVTGCISIFDFTSLLGTLSFTIGLNICAVTAGNKKYKSIIKKEEETRSNSIVTKI